MIELALSAGGRPALLALRNGSTVVAHSIEGRGTQLTETIATACSELAIHPSSIERVRVETGPGSFTGLRISVVTARTAAELGGASLGVFTRFELLAVRALSDGRLADGSTGCFLLDARRGRIHRGLVTIRSSVAVLDEPPAAVHADELKIPEGVTVFVDEGLDPAVLDACEGAPERREPLPSPKPEDLFADALHPIEAQPSEVLPLYLMGTYADDPRA